MNADVLGTAVIPVESRRFANWGVLASLPGLRSVVWFRRAVWAILPALLLAGSFGDLTPVQAQQTSGLITQDQAQAIGLERAWWGQAVFNPSRDKIAHIVIDEDNLYVQATSGHVTAFDAEDGRKLWAVLLGSNDDPMFPIAANETECIVIVGTKMVCMQKRTGKILWTLRLPGAPSTGAALDDDHVYYGTLNGSVYAFSLKRIRELYLEQRLPQWSYDAFVWKYKAAGEITSTPIAGGRLVKFASRDGSVYAVSARDRRLAFQFETDAPIVAPMALSGRSLYLASEDFTFYSIDAENGSVNWDFSTGLPIRKAPHVVGNDLFVTPDRGGMYCMSTSAGTQRWWNKAITQFVAVGGNSVYASDANMNLLMLSRSEGKVTGSLPVRHYSYRVANDRTDRLYLSTANGTVVCLRPTGRPYPTFHRYPDRLPLMPEFEPEPGTEPAADNPPPTATDTDSTI